MNWKLQTKNIPKNSLDLQKILLKNRNIAKADQKEFLNPTHPSDLTIKNLGFNVLEFKKAIKIIKKLIKDDEKIVIFGDYDVDGICASSIIWQVLFNLYKKTHPNGLNHPVPFIPHREKHGYGITEIAIDEIISSHSPKMIITVDNGIVAHKAITYAKNKGIQIILSDHHQPEFKQKKPIFPPADFILHSTQLCGASVAWMIAREINSSLANKLLYLAGMATIADQVELLRANRSFALYGLKSLQKSQNPGIQQLCLLAGLQQEAITAGSVGFVLAPRINAMGRLEHGLDALRLLCTQNKNQAKQLATILHETNVVRQDMTKEMLDDASIQANNYKNDNLIIVHSQDYHEGIVGLIAGGLVEKYYKPSIAISVTKNLAKASARSVFGVNIIELLREIQDELVSVGGHPMAAGFSFLPENLDKITQKLIKIFNKKIQKEQLEKLLIIDCVIPTNLINSKVIHSLSNLEPYGMSNPQPVFQTQKLKILETKLIGQEKSHLKLKVVDINETSAIAFDCLGWGMKNLYTQFKKDGIISVVGTLNINKWGEKAYPQIIIKDLSA
jgi:single-stranded-DNA-specific exonuclease